MGGPQDRFDFFISYTAADRAWAEWIAWQLEAERYTTVLQAWDFAPGENFVVRMRDALEQADRTIALLSEAYLASGYSTDEWTGAFLHEESGQERLLPVRVEACALPRLLAARIFIDLAGVSRPTAKQRLLEGVKRGRRRPDREPPGPWGTTGGALRREQEEPRFPAQGPGITNLPRRNLNFTGRRELLEALGSSLRAGARGAVMQTEAIHGLGGVGKTELALEYAHRYASDYDLVWWVVAEQPATVATSLVELAGRLGIGEAAQLTETIRELFDELRRRDRWLLVFDNAEAPQGLTDYLPPGGSGHILVTSRYAGWGRFAAPVRLDVLAHEEAVAFLQKRIGTADESAAGALAEALDGLPLALEEAAAYIETTGIGLDDYLGLLDARMAELFDLDAPTDTVEADERRVATIWSVSLDRVRTEAPGAEALLELCAFLAPEIPRSLLVEHTEVLPTELAEVTADFLRFNKTIKVLGRYSLATATPTTLGLHRLVQAVIRARLGLDAERQWVQVAVALMHDSFPSNSWELKTWPTCQRLLSHLRTVTEHAERLDLADETTGALLYRASTYLRGRGQPREARPLAERALTITQQALGSDHPTVGHRHDELGRVLRGLGDYRAARRQLEQALAIHEKAYGPENSLVGSRHNELGLVLRHLGDLAGARAAHERAVEIGQATPGRDHANMATRHTNLGLVLRDLGDLTGARIEHERALEIGQATLDPNHPNMATWHSNLGTVLADLGDLASAHIRQERAMTITEAGLGPDHPDMAARHSNLGTVLAALGDLTRARAAHERALGIGQATLAPNHPKMAAWHSNLGTVLRQLGDLLGARSQIERALEIGQATLGPNHPNMAAWHSNLGKVLADLGDLPGARSQHQRALEIGQATLSPNHPNMAAWHNNLGLVLREMDDLVSARIKHEQALEIGQATLGPNHPKMAAWHSNLGTVLRQLGDLLGARSQIERALEIGQATLGPNHPNMATWHDNLGQVLRELRDLPGARTEFKQAMEIAQATLGPDHPDVAKFGRNLDSVLQQVGGE